MTKENIEYWVIPPECDAEFVAHMGNVLETYEKPYNPSQPVICMDEQPATGATHQGNASADPSHERPSRAC